MSFVYRTAKFALKSTPCADATLHEDNVCDTSQPKNPMPSYTASAPVTSVASNVGFKYDGYSGYVSTGPPPMAYQPSQSIYNKPISSYTDMTRSSPNMSQYSTPNRLNTHSRDW